MSAIRGALERLGLARDAAVMVHSAFRGLAREGLAPQAVAEELCDYFASGTLLMPTMSWRFVKPANPEFSELDTPSNTGILTEVFRTTLATARSLHPTHSVAGIGRRAAELLAEHHLDPTPCSARSPFGKLPIVDGWVLMLGIGMDCCTLVHHGEETVAVDIYLKPASETETYLCRDRAGQAHTVRLRRHKFLPRDYWQFQDRLAASGRLRLTRIGNVLCRAFAARELHRMVIETLQARPDAILARDGQRYRRM
ncbi:MAG: AAC(3) family N-acetyltransferase [Betaproteobacteria bacterium]|nr:AAC(3) family N-acetyltransferase [Betaproteobacteria bacterium]